KESITADPTNSNYVYAVWDRFVTQGSSTPSSQGFFQDNTGHGPAFFARSTDGGATWEPARNISGPEARYFTINNQIVVLPNGDLVDEFTLFSSSNARGTRGANLAVMRSTDKGLTWSKPTIIAPLDAVQVVDPATGQPARTGDQGADITVDPNSGALYIAWEDARFSNGAYDGIAFSKSVDGGQTWSTPIEINHAPTVAAFTPNVQVASDGTVGVGYYDFRNDNPTTDPLLTDYWLVHSHDGGSTWTDETRITPTSFDLTTAPFVDTRGYFLGDYEGLAAVGKAFIPLFVQANSGNVTNRTDVFTTSVGP
ncbi:MAG TPA: sialidase family protein, partial [Chloroflexota bacterium]